MRSMLTAYLVLIAAGLVYAIVIGVDRGLGG